MSDLSKQQASGSLVTSRWLGGNNGARAASPIPFGGNELAQSIYTQAVAPVGATLRSSETATLTSRSAARI